MVNQTPVTPDLVNAVYHHTRRNERAIGVDFDSQKVLAIYDCLEELARSEVAKLQFATELKAQIDTMQNRMKQIMSMVEATKKKAALLNEAIKIQDRIGLAATMLEQLGNG